MFSVEQTRLKKKREYHGVRPAGKYLSGDKYLVRVETTVLTWPNSRT